MEAKCNYGMQIPSRYDQFVSRFVPGGTNRVRALRADRDTAPAAERIVGNEMESNRFKPARSQRAPPGLRGRSAEVSAPAAAAAAALEAEFAAGRGPLAG